MSSTFEAGAAASKPTAPLRAFAALEQRFAILAGVALAVIYGGLFGRLMSYDLRRDEELYAPPAALLKHFALYRDFFYNHTPLSAWLFRFIKVGSGTDHVLLAGRLGIFGGWILLGAGVAF